MPKKKMTLDKLARMMQRQFSDTTKEIRGSKKELKADIKELASSNNRIERKLDAEVERHDDQDLKIENHEERIIILEQKGKIKV